MVGQDMGIESNRIKINRMISFSGPPVPYAKKSIFNTSLDPALGPTLGPLLDVAYYYCSLVMELL